MRCFCCNAQEPAISDEPTGRYYCSTCWEVISDLIADKGDPEEVIITIEDLEGDPSYVPITGY